LDRRRSCKRIIIIINLHDVYITTLNLRASIHGGRNRCSGLPLLNALVKMFIICTVSSGPSAATKHIIASDSTAAARTLGLPPFVITGSNAVKASPNISSESEDAPRVIT